MPSKVIVKEAGAMADKDAHREWMKKNTVMINARLQRSTDADILQFLEGKNVQGEIKRGLRLLIANENRKTEEG